MFTPNANSITHPLHLSQRLFDLFRRSGGTFVKTNVTGFRNGPDGEPIWLSTDGESLPVDGLVIAAGAFSKPFAKSAGASVLLDTERGYHLWLPDPGVEMRRPIVVGDHKFGIVPMTGGVRLVGTVEFGGLDLAPDWRRADILAKLARPFVPGLQSRRRGALDGIPAVHARQSSPSSRAPDKQNVYLAFGHGHLGIDDGGSDWPGDLGWRQAARRMSILSRFVPIGSREGNNAYTGRRADSDGYCHIRTDGQRPRRGRSGRGFGLQANLKGHDSHGVGLVATYIRHFENGLLKPNTTAELIKDDGAILMFDGGRGLSRRVGGEAMNAAATRCASTGVVLMTLRNAHHIGRVGAYGEIAMSAGLISVHFVNVTDHLPTVAPWGGAEPRFVTNPVCIAVPGTENTPPTMLDMATSKIAPAERLAWRCPGENGLVRN